MSKSKSQDTLKKTSPGNSAGYMRLRLYIAGLTLRSQQTIQSLKKICEQAAGQVELEIIDIYQQPELARQNHIVATPTLIRVLPTPQRVVIGDLSRVERVISHLGITVSPDGSNLFIGGSI